MKTLAVDEFKNNFPRVLDFIKMGEEITISSKKKEKIAVLIPFKKYKSQKKRKLGILESRASFTIKEDFKISDEELLSS